MLLEVERPAEDPKTEKTEKTEKTARQDKLSPKKQIAAVQLATAKGMAAQRTDRELGAIRKKLAGKIGMSPAMTTRHATGLTRNANAALEEAGLSPSKVSSRFLIVAWYRTGQVKKTGQQRAIVKEMCKVADIPKKHRAKVIKALIAFRSEVKAGLKKTQS